MTLAARQQRRFASAVAILLLPVAAMARGVEPADLLSIIDIGPPAISPDRRWVAVETRQADLTQNRIVIRWKLVALVPPFRVSDIGDGGEPIVERFRGQITGYSEPQRAKWSSDSRWLAYRALPTQTGDSARSIGLWRSDLQGTAEDLSPHRAGDIDHFCFSRDGAQIFYALSDARRQFDETTAAEGRRGYLYDERFSPYHSRAPLFDPAPAANRELRARNVTTGEDREVSADEFAACNGDRPAGDPVLPRTHASRSSGVNAPLTLDGCEAAACTGYLTGVWPDRLGTGGYFLRWAGANDYGSMALFRMGPKARHPVLILQTTDYLASCERLEQKLLCAVESATHPRTLQWIDLRSGRRALVFDPNPGFRALEFGEVTPLVWHDATGIESFGHLVKPLHYQAGRRYPLMIVQYRSRGFLRGGTGDEYPIHAFSARGFAVLSFNRPNDPELEASVRSYEELEDKGWIGERDRRRVLSVLEAGIDELRHMGVIDADKVGITGLSDGGETVGFALATHSSRYAAAAASWIAYSPSVYFLMGPKFQSQLSRWGFGFPRGPAAARWQHVSLALNAESTNTPLLLQVSDQELLPESETVASLREFHKPVEMYVFPGEAHVKRQPQHRDAIYRRNLEWFQFWLQNHEVADPVEPGEYLRWRAMRAEWLRSLHGARPDR